MCKQSLVLCGEKKIILVTKIIILFKHEKKLFCRLLTQCSIAYFRWIQLDFIVYLLAIFCGMKKYDAIILLLINTNNNDFYN